jgi:hypothetical protein
VKTVELASAPVSAAELLEMARRDSLWIKTDQGDSFLVSHADEFATEVELLRRNHAFLTMLDEFKQGKDRIPLDQVERELR